MWVEIEVPTTCRNFSFGIHSDTPFKNSFSRMQQNISPVFPGKTWDYVKPETVQVASKKLDLSKEWFADNLKNENYRFLVIRHGKIILEENKGIPQSEKLAIASAAKSIYSSVFGIILLEKSFLSPDSKVYEYFPEMMEVKEGEGPKPGRYAFEKDRGITFRQLIGNTSGYMKPGEEPGKVFHYQTFGMNIFTHVLAKIYGYYDVDNPEKSPGFQQLIKEKIADQVGIEWDYEFKNFDHPEEAKIPIFGNYCRIKSTAPDLGRIGWLWCNNGRWNDRQIIPSAWHEIAIKTSAEVARNCPIENKKYGYGFWTNDHKQLWPSLPGTGYTAAGAGGFYMSVFPDESLVIVQAPGFYNKDEEANPELLKLVLEACE